MFKTILFSINHSREAIDALNKAIDLAKNQTSSIVLLSVLQNDHSLSNDSQIINELLDQTKRQIDQAGIPCKIITREGKPAFVICDVADEFNVDLIIMGTRGINLAEDKESTASRVIQLSPCPVLVVP